MGSHFVSIKGETSCHSVGLCCILETLQNSDPAPRRVCCLFFVLSTFFTNFVRGGRSVASTAAAVRARLTNSYTANDLSPFLLFTWQVEGFLSKSNEGEAKSAAAELMVLLRSA